MGAVGGAPRGHIPPFVTRQPSRFWGWVGWVASVLLCSCLLTAALGTFRQMTPTPPRQGAATPPDIAKSPTPPPIGPSAPAAPASAPARRRSTCAAGGVDEAAYDLPWHVGALFIILAVSTLACAFPMLARRFPGLRMPERFFFCVRHLGTGVLIATAFVHLFPTAFDTLGDPCLSDFWTDRYQPMPGAIALAAIFFVVVVEMVFHPSRHAVAPAAAGTQTGVLPGVSGAGAGGREAPDNGRVSLSRSTRGMAPLRGRANSIARQLSHHAQMGEVDGGGINRAAGRPGPAGAGGGPDDESDDARSAHSGAETNEPRGGRGGQSGNNGNNDKEWAAAAAAPPGELTAAQRHRKAVVQLVLVEFGILFHSVFIGMAISVAVGGDFVALLVAIVFHQAFEGLALGARIAEVAWPAGARQPWLMAVAYGCTTPAGQAIGLAVHSSYSPDSEAGLVLVGTMNAVSAGLLTFASLVELLSEDFLTEESWRDLRGRRRVCGCLLVLAGAFLMSLVGAWA